VFLRFLLPFVFLFHNIYNRMPPSRDYYKPYQNFVKTHTLTAKHAVFGKPRFLVANSELSPPENSRTVYRSLTFLDKERRAVGRAFVVSYPSLLKVLSFAQEQGWAVLNNGLWALTKEDFAKLKELKRACGRDYAKFYSSILREFSGKPYPYYADTLLIDIDQKDEETRRKLFRLVKFLTKLGVYPTVYETKKGFHFYIHIISRAVSVPVSKEKVEVHYYPVGEEDYKELLEDAVEALRNLLNAFKLNADFVSYKHSVFVEGLYNPIKEYATQCIFSGRPITIKKLARTLSKYIGIAKLKKRAVEFSKAKAKRQGVEHSIQLPDYNHSTLFHYLSQDGMLVLAWRIMDRTSGDIYAVERAILEKAQPKTRSDEKALENFLDHVRRTYRPLKQATKTEKERKHLHYYEYAPHIRDALSLGIQGLRAIARYVSEKLGKKVHHYVISEIFAIVPEGEFLNDYEKALEKLKKHAKGGVRLRDKEEWLKLAEEVGSKEVEACLQKVRQRKAERAEKKKEDKDTAKNPFHYLTISFGEGGRIGNSVFCFMREEDGQKKPLTVSPNQNKKSPSTPTAGVGGRLPFFPVLLMSKALPSVAISRLELALKKFADPEGLPVVLLIPHRGRVVLRRLSVKVKPSKELWTALKSLGKRMDGAPIFQGLAPSSQAYQKLVELMKGQEEVPALASFSLLFAPKPKLPTKWAEKPTPEPEPSKKELSYPKKALTALDYLLREKPQLMVKDAVKMLAERGLPDLPALVQALKQTHKEIRALAEQTQSLDELLFGMATVITHKYLLLADALRERLYAYAKQLFFARKATEQDNGGEGEQSKDLYLPKMATLLRILSELHRRQFVAVDVFVYLVLQACKQEKKDLTEKHALRVIRYYEGYLWKMLHKDGRTFYTPICPPEKTHVLRAIKNRKRQAS